jgi:hypothetical protein
MRKEMMKNLISKCPTLLPSKGQHFKLNFISGFKCRVKPYEKIVFFFSFLTFFSIPNVQAKLPEPSFLGTINVCDNGKQALTGGPTRVCLNDVVVAGEKAKYIDLLRLVLPNLNKDGVASKLKGPQSLLRKKSNTKLQSEYPYEPPININNTQFFSFGAEKSRWIALLIDQENDLDDTVRGIKLLALFQIKPIIKLIDSINVGEDRFTIFENNVLWNEEGSPLFFIKNSHHNCCENYQTYLIMGIIENKLKLLYDGPFLFGFRDENSGCLINQKADFLPIRVPSSSYPSIQMMVVEAKECENSKIKILKTYPALLKWDVRKQIYRGGSKELMKNNNKKVEG